MKPKKNIANYNYSLPVDRYIELSDEGIDQQILHMNKETANSHRHYGIINK